MEGIVCDLALTLSSLERAGVDIKLLRASGGGSRSDWWMQLKADLCSVTVEVVDQPEAGTLGAALLAGTSVKTYSSIEEAARTLDNRILHYEPNTERAQLYEDRLEAYKVAVKTLLFDQRERDKRA